MKKIWKKQRKIEKSKGNTEQSVCRIKYYEKGQLASYILYFILYQLFYILYYIEYDLFIEFCQCEKCESES